MLTRQLLADAWGGLSAGAIVRVALVLLLMNALASIATLPSQRDGITWGPYVVGFLAMQMKGFSVFMLVLVADRIADERGSALWPYAAAVLLGVVGGAMLLWLLTQHLLQIPTAVSLRKGLAYEPFLAFTYRHSNGALIIFSLATAAHVVRRRALHRLEALRAMQARSARLEQQLQQTRLASMRARIEPASIVTALRQAEGLYEQDPQAGSQALLSLARQLRGALAETRGLAAGAADQRLASS